MINMGKKLLAVIIVFAVAVCLFGCMFLKPEVLDGPGMEYVDSNYRTEYANTLPFDELEDYPYWAVVFLGRGAEGAANREYYIDKIFSSLSAEKIAQIKHFDFEGDEWYLVIPRYDGENLIIPTDNTKPTESVLSGEPFTVTCSSNIEIVDYYSGEHEFSPQIDENGRLICTGDVWDITEYEE